MKWNENIKNLRIDHDMSRKELADKLNISERSLYRYETGLCEPTISFFISISEIFNVSIDGIIGNTNRNIPDYSSKSKLISIKKSLKQLLNDINED